MIKRGVWKKRSKKHDVADEGGDPGPHRSLGDDRRAVEDQGDAVEGAAAGPSVAEPDEPAEDEGDLMFAVIFLAEWLVAIGAVVRWLHRDAEGDE